MTFGLSDSDFELFVQLAVKPLRLRGARLWIFGSRARGDYKKFSDIDLLYELPPGQSLPSGFLPKIRESLEESTLPYKVDIVNIQDLAKSYLENALKERATL